MLNLCCDAGRASGSTPTIPLHFLLADLGMDVIFLMLAPDFFLLNTCGGVYHHRK